jgi:hypothetical protein
MAGTLRLVDCSQQCTKEVMVFGAQIDIAMPGAYSITRDRQTFHQAKWIAFQNVPVFESANFAFVCIAYKVLFITWGIPGKFPLQATWETSTSPATQIGSLDFFYYLFWFHTAGFIKRLEAIPFYICVYTGGLDYPAVPEYDAQLGHS